MMKKDKILLQIDNLRDISFYNKLGITNLLFPLRNYSIGYKTFGFDEIKKYNNAYVLINRLLTDDDIDAFLKLDIPKNIKGFVVEDTGLCDIISGLGYEVIVFQNHLNNNYLTVNYWLNYYDSLVISTDITEDEVRKIVNHAIKPLVLNTFGYPMIMYSRRTLITNYYMHLNKEKKEYIDLLERSTNSHFFACENEYGTAIFNAKPIDYRSIIDEELDNNIKHYLINSSFCDKKIIEKVISQDDVESTRGFLDKKTVYKVGDIK